MKIFNFGFSIHVIDAFFVLLPLDHGDINKKMVCRRSMIARDSFVFSSQTGCYDRTSIVSRMIVCVYWFFSFFSRVHFHEHCIGFLTVLK